MGSAIHCACFGGNTPAVKSVLDRGAVLDQRMIVSIRKLSELAKRWDAIAPHRVVKLVQRYESEDGHAIECSPILLLAERCHFDLLSLCWAGYNIQPSCSPDDTWNLKKLREHQVKDGTSTTSSGWSFLGFPKPVKITDNCTLLMWAAASLNLNLIDHLLVAGANIDAQDIRGRSALHYAATPFSDALFNGIGACVQRLVQGGADVNKLDRRKRTPLMLAVSQEHASLDPRNTLKWDSDPREGFVKAFVAHGGLVDVARKMSNSLLLHAIRSNCQPAIIEFICDHGAALDLTDAGGLTLLSLVLFSCGDEAVVSILLKHGADPNAMNAQPANESEPSHPPTPLLVAIYIGCSQAIVSTLLTNGADPNLETHLGLTAAGLAKKRGRDNLLPLLGATDTASTTSTRPWLQRVSEFPTSIFRTYRKPT